VELDTEGWSGEGAFTQVLIDALRTVPLVRAVKVEDAPASRADAGFSFISNELFVTFALNRKRVPARRLWIIPSTVSVEEKAMSLASLETALAALSDVGPADYADEGMLQYLRTERIIPPYQTRGVKVVEMIRIYESAWAPARR
jgi:hypothetical protein